ncbi:MAG: hypothetical protein AB7H97_21650 [Pseudobdellovibrionaceae bacterium]
MSPEKIEAIVITKFPELLSARNLEAQLSSLETMDLLLHLEKTLGIHLQAIELEPLLKGDLNQFCEIVNGKNA